MTPRHCTALALAAALAACGGSSSPTVAVGPPAALRFRGEPAGAMSEVLMGQVEVAVVDDRGNTVPTATNQVTVALVAGPGGAALAGPAQVSAVGGSARFVGLTIDRVGLGYQLLATSPGLASATSRAFQVGPRLYVSGLPAETFSNQFFNPPVQVQAFDARQPYANATIRLSLDAAPGVAELTLANTSAVTDAAGAAPFGGTLAISGRGAALTLVARADPFDDPGTVGRSPPVDVLQIDQGLSDYDPASTLAVGGTSQQRLAQGVTIGAAGALVGVRLAASCSSGQLTVSVQGLSPGGLPDGVAKATGTFSMLPLDPGTVDGFPLLRFSSPPALQAGARIAIVLETQGECASYRGPVGDPYPGGEASSLAAPNSAWALLGGTRHDLPFHVVMR